jgi:SNF2 family DNA or RNA helicase
LNFIEPSSFPSQEDFQRQFSDLNNMGQLEILKTKLEPFMLRRMKEDVEKSIPPLQETILDIEMTNLQKMVYKTIYEKNKGTL